MAVSVAKIRGADHTAGNKKYRIRVVTFDSSYVQTGEPISAAEFGLQVFDTLEPMGAAIPTAGTTAWLVTAQVQSDRSQALLFVHGDGSQTATLPFLDEDSTADLSTAVVTMRAVGY